MKDLYDHKIETSPQGIEHLSKEKKRLSEQKKIKENTVCKIRKRNKK